MIDDGQRDHSLPLNLHVLKHVLVVDHLQGGVQLGLVHAGTERNKAQHRMIY